ncbi:MAG TPA: tRNA (guanosine(46)-N7)-methyltransferase TrmB [Thermoanaerobaculia bacterium]|nr:tRNA (guanosine(46)-N7)-methyltransferase TrmB [Thermoanaerobaculia bacterium]
MIQPALVSTAAGDHGIAELGAPLSLARLLPGEGAWEVEIGSGKGRYLLRRCGDSPERRFLAIELVAEYHRLFVGRARRRGAGNWIALRGEALYLLSVLLPQGFAAAVHVYFPDPWPKSRHHKRRLFDPESVDLVVGLLAPGGCLYFATDALAYGELVAELLASYPGLAVARRDRPWDDGPRTNYESKYMAEGRPILRLEAAQRGAAALHPCGAPGILCAASSRRSAPAGAESGLPSAG